MCEYIGAKSLKFLSLKGMYKALGKGERNDLSPQFTDHYFTGDYPIPPSDHLREDGITQLSFLSQTSVN